MSEIESRPYLPRPAWVAFVEFAAGGIWLSLAIASAFLLIGIERFPWDDLVAASSALADHVGWVLSTYITILIALYVAAFDRSPIASRRRVVALVAEVVAATTFPLLVLLAIGGGSPKGLIVLLAAIVVSGVVWFLAAQLGGHGVPEAADHLLLARTRAETASTRAQSLRYVSRHRAWWVLALNAAVATLIAIGVIALFVSMDPSVWIILAWYFACAVVLVSASWLSMVLFFVSADRWSAIAAAIPGGLVHFTLVVLNVFLLVGSSNGRLIAGSIVAGQAFVLLSSLLPLRGRIGGLAIRSVSVRTARWALARQERSARDEVVQLEKLLEPPAKRSRWRRLVDALSSRQ